MSGTSLGSFARAYATALREYLARGSEADLEQAYELGRKALAEQLSMLDMARVHHDVLLAALAGAGETDQAGRLGRKATDFFVETLSTFEMAQRGARDALETGRAEREHARRLRLLADAFVAINVSHAPDRMLELIVEQVRRVLEARRAAVTFVFADGTRRAARAPDGPAQEGLVPWDSGLVTRALAADDPTLAGPRELRTAGARHPDEAWMAVPLLARAGRRFGLIEASGPARGDFGDDDVAIVLPLAQMTSAALENARLYEREHAIAQTLQRSLLPKRLPRIAGLDVAAFYRAAGDGNEVGGDFYDLFKVADSQWIAVIGDVCGKGAEAAAVTALARYTLRAAALHGHEPRDMLDSLNQAILTQRSDQRFCTVACAALTVGGQGVHVEITHGGHPPALVLREGGAVEELGAPGTVLGVFADADLPQAGADLRPGDTIVLYTDGLTDARAPRQIVDTRQLTELVAGCAGLDAAGVVDRLEATITGEHHGTPRDDVAILVLALEPAARRAAGGPAPVPSRVSFRLTPRLTAPYLARRRLSELAGGLDPRALEDAQVIVSELVTNSLRHAGLGLDDEIEVEVTVTERLVRVDVIDTGPGFDVSGVSDPGLAGSGRGLLLVSRLADRWGVRRLPRTRVWAEIDLPQ